MNARTLSHYGFDVPRLAYAARTALAACIALALAWALGLEHPQWSAMTVWAASQPTRGQLLEKGFFRFAGTISGTIAGICLVLASALHPALMIGGLTLWVGLCAGIGNLQRGFVAYGTILAGYTAAMVALLDTAHPDHVLYLGLDRLATVLAGVLVAMAAGFAFAPPSGASPLRARVRQLSSDLLRAMAAHDGQAALRTEPAHRLLSDMAAIEELLEPHGAGSLRSRREVRATRMLLGAALSALLWLRSTTDGPAQDLRPFLDEAATALQTDETAAALDALSRAAALARTAAPDLHEVLQRLEAAMRHWNDDSAAPAPEAPPVALHRDWIGAREAAIRAMVTLALFGALWLATGWNTGALMLLGTSIMVSVFSTFDNPAMTMRFVFLGQCLGVLGALACRWLAWPLAGTEMELIGLTMPFILLGALLVGHRSTTATSFDYNMVLMLMLQPAWPLNGSFAASLSAGMSIVAAPLAAMLAYRYIYPAGLQRRLETLIAMMLHDLEDMALDPQAPAHRRLWRARLYHRMLRLVRLSEKSGRANISALDSSLALLDLSHVAMRCHEMLGLPRTNPAGRRAASAVLARMREIRARPTRLERTLVRAAQRLEEPDAGLFVRAANGMADNPRFFERRNLPAAR